MNKEQFAVAFDKLYKSHVCGGHCHIVTDDLNVEDEHIEFCLNSVEENYHEQTPEIQQVERDILNYLLAIPEEDRESHIRYAEDVMRANYRKSKSC